MEALSKYWLNENIIVYDLYLMVGSTEAGPEIVIRMRVLYWEYFQGEKIIRRMWKERKLNKDVRSNITLERVTLPRPTEETCRP